MEPLRHKQEEIEISLTDVDELSDTSRWSCWDWLCLPRRDYRARMPRFTEPQGLRIIEKINDVAKF